MTWLLKNLLGIDPARVASADGWNIGFVAAYGNWIVLAIWAAFALLVGLSLWQLHRSTGSLRLHAVLGGLRVAVLGCLLAMLFQPALILQYRQEANAALVVLLDDSLSMSLTDRYAKPERRQALCDRLHIDPADLDKLSRRELVQRVLGGQGGALAGLARDHALVLMGFSTDKPGAEPYTRTLGQLARGLAAPAAGRDVDAALGQLKAGGYETNLAAALRDAVDKLPGRRIAGVVLVSDGRIALSGGDSAGAVSSALSYLGQRGIATYAVAVGDDQLRRNVTLHRLQAPQEARKGSEMELVAQLTARNCQGRHFELELRRRDAQGGAWSDVLARQAVTVGEQEDIEVPLRWTEPRSGDFEYQVEAVGVPDESNTDDNRATAAVKLTEQKTRILLASGDGGWEFQYLRNLLLRDTESYAVSVWQQDADAQFNQDASTGMRLTHLPANRNELFSYDAIVLYDPLLVEGSFDGGFIQMLQSFVADHHGGLCFIASNKHISTALGNPTAALQPLAALLPVEMGDEALNVSLYITRGQAVPWHVVPTEAGLEHPVPRLAGDAAALRRTWAQLPGVFWSHPLRRLKPLATALAVSSDPAARTLEGATPLPLLAAQYYGKGRVLYVGIDETWRWRAVAEGYYYRRFWSNVIDFLASGRLQKKRVVLTSGADRFALGSTLHLRAEALYDANYEPLEAPTLAAEMLDAATGKARTIELKRDPTGGAKGQYEALVKLDGLGTFDLTAKMEGVAATDIAGKRIVVALPEEEFRRAEADRSTLAEIAPGDRLVDLAAADTLAGRIVPENTAIFSQQIHDLWDTPAVLGLIVVLLAAGWIVRKHNNLS